MNSLTHNVPPSAPSRRPYVSRAIGAVLIIVLVALAAYGAYRYFRPQRMDTVGPLGNARITLAADAVPAHDVMIVDALHRKLMPEHVASQGTQNLYAEASTTDSEYYLISGPAAGQSTLYKLDRAHQDAGPQQLSTSTSEKVSLSVNEPAGIAAFTAYSTGGAPHITVIDLKSRKETDLGEGTHPTVLADGRSVLFEKAGILVSKDIARGTEYTMAALPDGALFAVDTYRSQFALYDPSRNVIRTYQIMNSGTLSKQADSSTPSDSPGALFYLHDALYMARTADGMLVLSGVDGSSPVQIPAPGFSLGGFTITAL